MVKTIFTWSVILSVILILVYLGLNAKQIAVRDRINFYAGNKIPLDPIGEIEKEPGMEHWLEVTDKGLFNVIPPKEESKESHKKVWDLQQSIKKTLEEAANKS